MDAIEQKVLMMEAKIAELEARIAANPSADNWLNMLTAKVNQLARDLQAQPQLLPGPSMQSAADAAGGSSFMPDGNCSHATSDQTKTIEWRPGTDAHKHELQLANADDLVADTDGQFPYIDVDASGNGVLAWIELRSDATPEKVVPDSSGSAGTSTTVSRSDHTHPMDAISPGSSVPDGVYTGDILYWNATSSEWVVLTRPSTPSLLAWNSGSGVYWFALGTQYKVVQSGSADFENNWVKAH